MLELNKCHCMDCREFLKHFPDQFFDCVASDVPYKIVTGGARISEESIEKFGKTDPKGIFNRCVVNDKLKQKWLKKSADADNALFVSEGKLFEHCEIKFEEWLPEVYRVLKDGSHAYFMVNSRNLTELQTKAEQYGFKFMNLLVWVKNNATPNKYYMQQCEFILMMRKGYAKNINNMGATNVFNIPNIIGNKFHPTEKPIGLMKQLIMQSTQPGDVVLEPFAGSGSTCVAAKELGIDFAACEISEKYCATANERIEQGLFKKRTEAEQSQMNLFSAQ